MSELYFVKNRPQLPHEKEFCFEFDQNFNVSVIKNNVRLFPFPLCSSISFEVVSLSTVFAAKSPFHTGLVFDDVGISLGVTFWLRKTKTDLMKF